MTDTTPEVDDSSGPRWALIIVSVLVVVGAAVAAFALFGGDDDDDAAATTTTASVAPTTAPPTTGPATTAAPTTTPAETTTPPTSAPATTAAPPTGPPSTLEFSIDGIDDGGEIPVEFTCDGDEIPPVVTVESSPEGTLQLAFVVDDPDAPTEEPFVHWVVYGIPGNTSSFTDGEEALLYGVNDAGNEGWTGPCPPEGEEHEYDFTLFALNRPLELEPGLDGRELEDAIEDATIAETDVSATYRRAG